MDNEQKDEKRPLRRYGLGEGVSFADLLAAQDLSSASVGTGHLVQLKGLHQPASPQAEGEDQPCRASTTEDAYIALCGKLDW